MSYRSRYTFRAQLRSLGDMTDRPRDLGREHAIITTAARGTNADRLIHRARDRSIHLSTPYVANPMTVNDSVDHLANAREEFEDACNRIVWWIEEHPRHHDAPRVRQALEALVRSYTLIDIEANP